MTAQHTLQELQTLEGHTDRVWHLAWSPDGKSLASCSGDRTVRIWQKSSYEGRGWRCAALLEDTHTKSIRCCCWSPGSTHLATASFDGTTSIWQVQGGMWEEVAKLEGHENEVKAVAWSPCGNYIATCGRDKTVWFWERGVGEEYDCMDVKHGHSQDVKSIAWHPTKELLASCSYDNSIKLWLNDEGDWICIQTLEGAAVGHSSTVWSVCFSPDGTRLASVSDDLTIRIWNITMRSYQEDNGHDHADNDYAAVGLCQPHVTLAATISGYHKRTLFSVDWSSSGVLVTGDGANSIKLFAQPGPSASATDSMPEVSTMLEPNTAAAAAAAAVSGNGLHQDGINSNPTNSESSYQGPWECLLSVDAAHASDVNCVRWHPHDVGLLASAGDDGTVKLWRHNAPAAAAPPAAAAAVGVDPVGS